MGPRRRQAAIKPKAKQRAAATPKAEPVFVPLTNLGARCDVPDCIAPACPGCSLENAPVFAPLNNLPDDAGVHETYCSCAGHWSLCCDNAANYSDVPPEDQRRGSATVHTMQRMHTVSFDDANNGINNREVAVKAAMVRFDMTLSDGAY
jgi:hypothetical protein